MEFPVFGHKLQTTSPYVSPKITASCTTGSSSVFQVRSVDLPRRGPGIGRGTDLRRGSNPHHGAAEKVGGEAAEGYDQREQERQRRDQLRSRQ